MRIYELDQQVKFLIVLLCFLCVFESYHTVAGKAWQVWTVGHNYMMNPCHLVYRPKVALMISFVGIGNCPSALIWFVNSCVICCGFGLDLFRLGLHR